MENGRSVVLRNQRRWPKKLLIADVLNNNYALLYLIQIESKNCSVLFRDNVAQILRDRADLYHYKR